ILSSFVTMNSNDATSDVQDNECTICLSKMTDGELIQLPCNHWFHVGGNGTTCDGLIHWLQTHGTCPSCRKSHASTSGASPGGRMLIVTDPCALPGHILSTDPVDCA